MFDAGAHVNAVDAQVDTTLWEIADEVKDADKKAAVEEVLSEYSLHAAAKAGKAERVSSFIAAGQDVNARGTEPGDCGQSPAHWAAAGGHGRVLKLLLDAGADVNTEDGVRLVNNAMNMTRDEEKEEGGEERCAVCECGANCVVCVWVEGWGGERRCACRVCVFVCVFVCVCVCEAGADVKCCQWAAWDAGAPGGGGRAQRGAQAAAGRGRGCECCFV